VTRDDRVRPSVRVLAAVILPFLLVANVLLYLLPDRTDELFAWTIEPRLTAMFLASAYVGGIWFFARVLGARRWHHVKYGFPAVVLFATLLGIATFLHWDRFHFGHISFITWVTLYVTTPVVVLVVAVANWREDPARPDGRDYAVPFAVRALLAVVGAVALVCGLTLFAAPALIVDVWAWQLTPLTARVVGAALTLPGAVNLWLLGDARWSAFRAIFQAQIVSLVFIVLALVIARADLLGPRPVVAAFIIGIVLSLVAFLAFYAYCERRSREAPGSP
jgi:hypothetical protein